MSLIDLIFPKKCINCRKFGDFLCPDCFSKISYNQIFVCASCFRPSINGLTHPKCAKPLLIEGVIPVVEYNRIVKKIVYQFKYEPYLSNLCEKAGEIMAEGLSQNESFYTFIEKFQPAIIPVPLSLKRERQRGYNHAGLIGHYVAQSFKLNFDDKVLIRVKDTKPQYKLNKEARIKNLAGAFQVAQKTNLPRNIILVDDIATSFATLKEAAKTLKRHGAQKVLGITFAKEV